MHVLVFGATGRVGAAAVEYALAAGHQVTALVRNPARVALSHPQLAVVAGDVYRPESLEAPLRSGVDAVVNAVGADVFKPSTLVTDSARAIVAAMQAAGVERYLAITGTAQMSACGLGGLTQIMLRRSPIRHAVRDHDGALPLVTQSGLRWTLAGCPYIRDGRRTGAYKRVTSCFSGGFKSISAPDVADFFVRELAEGRYERTIVGIWS